jgi:hypothetical protein
MTGSGIGAETFGIGTEAVTCGDCATKRSKFGKVKRSKLGKENFGKDNEKRSRLGKELAVAAPMTAKADKDTTIAGSRLDAPCGGASGGLSPCVSLSGVSATCVPLRVSPLARFLLAADQQHKKEPSRGRSGDDSRAIAPPKFSLNHGLIWLTISYSQPSRVLADLPPVADPSPSDA